MVRVYYDIDADLEILKNRKVAVLGYKNHGYAHAWNLRDSGIPVIVGLDDSEAGEAKADGFEVLSVADAVREADVTALLVPDNMQARMYAESVEPNLKPGAALVFANGFAVHFGLIVPPETNDVILAAPKGPGYIVRRMYAEGRGVPAFAAVYRDASGTAMDLALAYASGIGAGRAGIIETTFAEEAEAGLFSQQAVVCGGASELIKAGFDTLVEAGYQPEIAYFNCLYEMKITMDAIFDGGLSWMRHSAGDIANYGDSVAGERIIGSAARETMKRLLADVQNGVFVSNWARENDAGRAEIEKWLKAERKQFIDKAGLRLRIMMPWMDVE